MRLPLPCIECAETKADPATEMITGIFLFVGMEGDHLFRLSCPEGHSSIVGLQQPHFEMLYESGSLALIDGYYREAVASFASASERFYEYWLRATLLQVGVPADSVDLTWKQMGKQSERQYGAFVSLYVRQKGRMPRTIPDRLVNFRNDIIHKGLFPSEAEARDYGQEVVGLIAGLWRELDEDAPLGIAALRTEQNAAITSAGAYPGQVVTILSRAKSRWPASVRLVEELQLLDGRRSGRGGAKIDRSETSVL